MYYILVPFLINFHIYAINVRDHGHLLCGLSNSSHIEHPKAAAMRSNSSSVGESLPFSTSLRVVFDMPHFFDSLRSEYPLQFRISQIFMTIMQILCLTHGGMSLRNLWKLIKFMAIAIAKLGVNMYNLVSLSAKKQNGGN